jgi:hypothetical protein
MIRRVATSVLIFAISARLSAQEPTAPPAPPTPVTSATPATATTTTMQKRGWFGRIMHPFSSSAVMPKYKDPKLRGLILELQVAPQPVKLSEVRQVEIKATLTNQAKGPITLDFPTDQRIEIYLMNSADLVLTKWSDNHAVNEKPSLVLINPGEHVEYKETIATRDLTPNKVFIAEVFFPKYPDLRIRQKFLTEP